MAETGQAGGAGAKPARQVNRIVVGSMAALVVAVVAAVFFAYRFVETERVRTLQEWQVRLGIVADSRAAVAASLSFPTRN